MSLRLNSLAAKSAVLRPSALLRRPMPPPAPAPLLARWLCAARDAIWDNWVDRAEAARAGYEAFAKEHAEQQAAVQAKIRLGLSLIHI